jgi:hypothetical protein
MFAHPHRSLDPAPPPVQSPTARFRTRAATLFSSATDFRARRRSLPGQALMDLKPNPKL